MKKGFILVFFLFHLILFAQRETNILISEIMFAPFEKNGEYIELFNNSDSISINLDHYFIIYSTSQADTIVAKKGGTILKPKSYAIILENDYNYDSGIYLGLIPDSSIILQIDNGKFGSSGMSNSSDRTIFLMSKTADTIDVYTYSADNGAGFSDEKIVLEGENNSENWGNSILQNGTPGFRNSITPLNYDLEITDLNFSSEIVFAEESSNLVVSLFNNGLNSANYFSLKLFIDYNNDSLSQANEIIFDTVSAGLNSNDSLSYMTEIIPEHDGVFRIIASLNYNEDENLENNIKSIDVLIHPKPNNYGDIVINEIMFTPGEDEPEWVELYNRTPNPVNLKDWRFADRRSKPKIIDTSYFIGANRFLVLSEEETIIDFYKMDSTIILTNLPSLNNLGDDLKLIDSLGNTIDSVSYNSGWGNGKGVSLERVDVNNGTSDSINWKGSVSRFFATPNRINSVTPKDYDLQISGFSILENYGVLGEDITCQIIVKNIGLNNIENFKAALYKDNNNNRFDEDDEMFFLSSQFRLNKGDSTTILYSTNNFSEGKNLFWAKAICGNDSELENNLISMHFTGVKINERRNDIIINEIMYSPISPETEWIELYNNSSKKINLRNYQLADAKDTTTIITSDLFIDFGKYAVIADDSSFINLHSGIDNLVIVNFPNLNNSGDRIILLDSLNRVIDSLSYSQSLGGHSGYSLERVSPLIASTDSLNWTSSLFTAGTPGKTNSVSQKNFDVALNSILFLPNTPDINEEVTISAKAKNIGKKNIAFQFQLSEILTPDSSLSVLETSTTLSLPTSDSIIFTFNFKIDSIKSERSFKILIIATTDENLKNNALQASIAPQINRDLIVINEIMYSPINGEPEWIELYNQSGYSLDLKNFTISDLYTTPKTTSVFNDNFILQPHHFIVIAKDSLLSDYHTKIPSEIIVSKFANLNNDIDGVVIKDKFGNTVDSVLFKSTWGGTNGYSLERILCNLQSTDSSTWKSSIDIEQSTPGRRNSVTPYEYDLKISSLETIPKIPIKNNEIIVATTILNSGLKKTTNASLDVFYKTGRDSTFLETISPITLSPLDSITVFSRKSFRTTDSVTISAFVNYELDQYLQNNYLKKVVCSGFPKSAVVINEFMANPSSGCSEWIELCNPGSDAVDISGWFISDILNSSSPKLITAKKKFILPDEYLVITNDSSNYCRAENEKITEVKFGNLGNNSDGIILLDFNRNVIDSIYYNSEWHIPKGRSMERVSSKPTANSFSEWLPSLGLTGSSAGKRNSVTQTKPAQLQSVIINEIMFQPESDNCDFIEIYNNCDSSINIGGWQIIDGTNNYSEVSRTLFELHPKSYFLIAADSVVFTKYRLPSENISISPISLSTNGETILLADHWGNIIDSVQFSPQWHNNNIISTKNKSLEKISPEINGNIESNWSTSVDNFGATPNRKNSIFTENNNTRRGISFSPNPFSPDNDGFEDFTIINYNLPFNVSQIRVKIFDDKGRPVRNLVNGTGVSQNGSLIFNGLDDNGNPLRIGMYILFFEAVNLKDNDRVVYKDVLVIARKL